MSILNIEFRLAITEFQQADDVERNGQRVVADMRGTLEKLAQRIESLKKAKERSYRGVGWAILKSLRSQLVSWASDDGWWGNHE